jgi:dienelactone hydrolase
LNLDWKVLKSMRLPGVSQALCLLSALAFQMTAQSVEKSAGLVPGVVLDQIPCDVDPTQSYAVYLPSSYTPLERWPIIYAFDPEARGKVPVNLYKEVAEKYGYIIVGSNNSRNFSAADSSKGATAMWKDTHGRLSLDERRTYTTGFSGGARMAGQVALSCQQCQIAGVIAHGAGYPSNRSPSEKDRLPYFLAVGDRDFNWPEIISIRRERENLGMPYRVRVFQGAHRWAPPEVFEDGIEWMQLKAMQSGSLADNGQFLESLYRRREEEAGDAERRSDAIAELNAYRSLVSDFSGLKDVSEYEKKLTALKSSPSLKEALKKEQGQITTQAKLTGEISTKLSAMADIANDEQRSTLSAAVSEEMRRLKDEGVHFKPEGQRLVFLRAYGDLWAQGIETGQAEFESRHFERAELYFRLMGEIDDDPWPALLLAETRTAMGNKKQALKDLHEAIRRGLRNPEILEEDPNLRPLNADPEFKKLIVELKSK